MHARAVWLPKPPSNLAPGGKGGPSRGSRQQPWVSAHSHRKANTEICSVAVPRSLCRFRLEWHDLEWWPLGWSHLVHCSFDVMPGGLIIRLAGARQRGFKMPKHFGAKVRLAFCLGLVRHRLL